MLCPWHVPTEAFLSMLCPPPPTHMHQIQKHGGKAALVVPLPWLLSELKSLVFLSMAAGGTPGDASLSYFWVVTDVIRTGCVLCA